MKSDLPERPYTIKEAAALLGLPTWKLQRAVRRGLVPSYTFLNHRKLVRLSEINAALKRQGGASTVTASSSSAAYEDGTDAAFHGGSHE